MYTNDLTPESVIAMLPHPYVIARDTLAAFSGLKNLSVPKQSIRPIDEHSTFAVLKPGFHLSFLCWVR